MKKLTKKQIEAMRAVAEGADVYSRGIAQLLREVQLKNPALISIAPAARVNRRDRPQPYFAAKLTRVGVEHITPKKILRSIAHHAHEARP